MRRPAFAGESTWGHRHGVRSHRRQIAERLMQSLAIVEDLDVLVDGGPPSVLLNPEDTGQRGIVDSDERSLFMFLSGAR